ncbi:transcriptional regulator [Clostridium manihotivorum]|uniref:Transcriptional regulator n=2 Tax=Clostridium manihotivorum TaxID=2320868 RepID=A0A410DQC3_9CLOT|nr:helix-turn-helix domain-containing protein [Clostridium manihotivorum]QAA31258.1 transcriptional regulator [Clostridium manihotivorum]
MAVKNRLREIRMKEFMMEPTEFADMLQVNPKSYYQWESGASRPNLEKSLQVAKKLNRNVNDIWYLE